MYKRQFHGCGWKLVPEALRGLGVKNLYCVEQQMVLDGTFPTVASPNPENPEGFYLAIELADKVGADFILGTDPDSDRVGIMVRGADGKFIAVTGNQTGVLLLDYLIGAMKRSGKMPANPVALKTIVTTEMARKVAESNGVKCFDTFTGFKFLAEKIKQFEQDGSHEYIFAFEESYGYLCGDYARDKDAVTASMLIAEMAAYYRTQGKTLYDAMLGLYEKYGYYKDTVKSIGLKGIEGLAKIQEIMENFRKNPPKALGGYEVTSVRDYKKNTITEVATGEVKETGLPESNVLYYDMNDGAWLCIRPSGTEPKIKFYYGVKGTSLDDAEAKSKALGAAVMAMVDKMM
mgnify:CR=1 FL=1